MHYQGRNGHGFTFDLIVEMANSQLQGAAMAGTALAYTIGGMLNDKINDIAPFLVTLALVVLCTIQIWFTLPYVAPKWTEGPSSSEGEKRYHGKHRHHCHRKPKKQRTRLQRIKKQVRDFLQPLKVFKRRRLEDWNGMSYYGVTLLAVGMFVNVFAVAYVVSLGNSMHNPGE